MKLVGGGTRTGDFRRNNVVNRWTAGLEKGVGGRVWANSQVGFEGIGWWVGTNLKLLTRASEGGGGYQELQRLDVAIP